MNSVLVLGAYALAAALPVGTELQYTGKLERGDATGNPEKTFSLVVTQVAPEQLVFLLEERGGTGWNWPQRFGQIDVNDPQSVGVRLLHQFEGTPTPLPVRRVLFEYADRLTPETEWSGRDGQYECIRKRMVNGREVAVVEVAMDRGRRQTLEVETETGVLMTLRERLFLGRGDAFQLTMQLELRRELKPEELASTRAISAALVKLQSSLTLPDARQRTWLNDEEIVAAEQTVSRLQPVPDTNWGRLVTSIQRDLVAQTRRLEGVAGLAQKFLGQSTSTRGDWKRVDGKPLDQSARAGHTTVLHFWEYNGDKLVEPYGQVGYLDFLHNRRHRLGAQVIGVAVDTRFGDPAQSRVAAQPVRKFQTFMNVSFPIIIDDGALLSRFGDPRTIGAELPLWVVIGHDGKVTHYKVGYYDLKPDEGLRELDAAVVEALKREKAAERKE